MAKTTPTELQLEVLQWIADGCPTGVMADPKFKVSAYALDRRNLVRVKRRKNPWIAEITNEGKELLANGGAADLSPARRATAAPSAPRPSAEVPSAPTATSRSVPAPARVPTAPAKSATQKMMDRLLAEDVIEFANAETGRYRQLATVARRKKLFPDDMELVISTSWSAPCTIELKRRPEWQLVVLDPIDVPATIRTPHAVVTRLREQRTDRLGMDVPRWNWSLRVIQGLALEIERRGYVVKAPPAPKPDRYGYVSREQQLTGHLAVSIGDHEFQLYIGQARDERPHLLTASELRRKAKGYAVSTTESFKTDFVTIRLTGLEPPFWQAEWVETESARADSLLPRILQEMELRASRAVDRQLEKQRREDEKRPQWEVVRDRAIQRLNEDHRAKVLLDQAGRFRRVQELGEYIAAVRSRIGSMNLADAAAATAWLQWAESHATAINPLLGDIRMPDDPKPDADAIKPYMNGWSPYGPERSLWG
jgi:hypothetical protein